MCWGERGVKSRRINLGQGIIRLTILKSWPCTARIAAINRQLQRRWLPMVETRAQEASATPLIHDGQIRNAGTLTGHQPPPRGWCYQNNEKNFKHFARPVVGNNCVCVRLFHSCKILITSYYCSSPTSTFTTGLILLYRAQNVMSMWEHEAKSVQRDGIIQTCVILAA